MNNRRTGGGFGIVSEKSSAQEPYTEWLHFVYAKYTKLRIDGFETKSCMGKLK